MKIEQRTVDNSSLKEKRKEGGHISQADRNSENRTADRRHIQKGRKSDKLKGNEQRTRNTEKQKGIEDKEHIKTEGGGK